MRILPVLSVGTLFIMVNLPVAVAKAPTVPCAFLFKHADELDPNRVKWDRKLSLGHPVVDQGVTGACWAIEGSESLAVTLRELGLLPSGENLSFEFYYHAQISELFSHPPRDLTLKRFMEIDDLLQEGGGYVADYVALIKKYGVVTESAYQSAPRLLSGLRMGSDAYRARLIEAIRKIRSKRRWRDARKVFFEYVGDLEGISAQAAKPTFEQMNSLKVLHLIRGLDGTRHTEPAKYLLDGIRASLDAGKPIVAGISIHYDVFERISRMNSSAGFTYRPWEEWAHSMLVIGYKADSRGEIEYLLVRNSWGKGWGKDGVVTLDRKFLEYYLSDIEQVDSVPGLRKAWEKLDRIQRR